MNFLAGIDIGSTTLKAVLYDESGDLVASGSRPTGGRGRGGESVCHERSFGFRPRVGAASLVRSWDTTWLGAGVLFLLTFPFGPGRLIDSTAASNAQ